jgi:hypothetical protein
MTSRLGRRLALLFAAGMIVCLGEPLHAALTSGAADARAAEASWLGDTLSPADVINLKPLVGNRAAAAGSAKPRPVVVAQAQGAQAPMIT